MHLLFCLLRALAILSLCKTSKSIDDCALWLVRCCYIFYLSLGHCCKLARLSNGLQALGQVLHLLAHKAICLRRCLPLQRQRGAVYVVSLATGLILILLLRELCKNGKIR